MKIQEIETYVKAGKLDEKLIELYGQEDLAHQKERYLSILQEAEKAGVHILAYSCQVRKDLINLAKPVRVYVNGKEESEEQETLC